MTEVPTEAALEYFHRGAPEQKHENIMEVGWPLCTPQKLMCSLRAAQRKSRSALSLNPSSNFEKMWDEQRTAEVWENRKTHIKKHKTTSLCLWDVWRTRGRAWRCDRCLNAAEQHLLSKTEQSTYNGRFSYHRNEDMITLFGRLCDLCKSILTGYKCWWFGSEQWVFLRTHFLPFLWQQNHKNEGLFF